MNYVDYIIIAVLVIGFVLGYKDGLLRKIIGLSGLALGIYLAFKFYNRLSPLLNGFFEGDTYLSELVSGAFILIVVVVIAAVLKRIVHPFDKVNFFVNKLLGGAAGIFQISLYLSCLLLMLYNFNFPKHETAQKSYLYPKVISIVPSILNKLTDSASTSREILSEILKNNDKVKEHK